MKKCDAEEGSEGSGDFVLAFVGFVHAIGHVLVFVVAVVCGGCESLVELLDVEDSGYEKEQTSTITLQVINGQHGPADTSWLNGSSTRRYIPAQCECIIESDADDSATHAPR